MYSLLYYSSKLGNSHEQHDSRQAMNNGKWNVPLFIYMHKKTSWCIAVYFNYCLI